MYWDPRLIWTVFTAGLHAQMAFRRPLSAIVAVPSEARKAASAPDRRVSVSNCAAGGGQKRPGQAQLRVIQAPGAGDFRPIEPWTPRPTTALATAPAVDTLSTMGWTLRLDTGAGNPPTGPGRTGCS